LDKNSLHHIQHQLLLRVTAFCEALGIKEATGRKWVQERRIASVKLGRAIRIPVSELGRMIRDGFRPARQDREAQIEEGHGSAGQEQGMDKT
jgi:excisionase family DNA binding protein